ncbi:MAG: OB-fold nucleic acid binding domain-containing protein [Candidatus Micrarchaeota archaeon]
MKIKDLTPNTGNVDLEADVVSVEEPREINKMGRTITVANVTISDDSGTITLVLWNENIEKVSEGAKLKITNGYVNTWRDQPQLTLGKFGKLEIL